MWVVIGVLIMVGIGPYLLVGAWYEGLAGVWVMIQAVGVVTALAIFFIAMEGSPKRRRK